MKKIFFLILLAGINLPAIAQKSKKTNKTPQTNPVESPVKAIDNPEERRGMMEARALGAMHQLLIQWAGHWHDEMKIWTEGNPNFTTATVERDGRIVSEGRFLSSTMIGQMNGTHYEAQSLLGYDNLKRVFTKTWIDNLGTSILVLEGIYDTNTNSIDFTGFTTSPVTRKPIKIHQVLKVKDPTTQELTVFLETKDGKEFKAIEIMSKRN